MTALNFVEFTVALQLIAIAYAGGEISLKSLSMDSAKTLPLPLIPGSGVQIPQETTMQAPHQFASLVTGLSSANSRRRKLIHK